MKYFKKIETVIGKINIVEEDGYIIMVDIGEKEDMKNIEEKDTKLLKEAEKQLEEYFSLKRKQFNLPYKQEGTTFMKKVWNALQEIPYGETRSYKQIAEEIGKPKAVRAVGMANNKNKIPIIIPCHRVIGSNGKLIGYALGLDVKKYLLDLESKNK